MIKSLASIVVFVTLTWASSLQAEDITTSVKGVHICCDGCLSDIQETLGKIKGTTTEVDKDSGTVTITANKKGQVNKALKALVKAGYFGASSNPDFPLPENKGAKDKQVTSLTVKDLHLCCNGCVKSVKAALATVPGVTGSTVEKDAQSFEVTGQFNSKEVFAAFNKAGLSGKAGKSKKAPK